MDNPSSARPQRASGGAVALALAGVGGNLMVASVVTLTLMAGMVLTLVLAVVFIMGSENPATGLAIAAAITLAFNALSFFISPWIMDLIQKWLYGTRWVELSEIERFSPETGRVLRKVCDENNLKQPSLGIIDDQNPTAFTYGTLPNSARLVVSQGLFTYLEDEEAAAVYAHELGHIVHWDFAVMTIASTLVQMCYLVYMFGRRVSGGSDNRVASAMRTAALVAYIFYLVGSYLLLYLSRTREYLADHFSAKTTGNPNALSRALVKIAYGIVEEGERSKEPSKLLEGTRALGIYDAKAATSTGTAYRISSSPEAVGRVFLWDMFNPWGWWMELNSTHPLTGKRVRALSTYAEQLGLAIEFDMGRVIGEGKGLNKKRLYGNFAMDLVLYSAEGIGLLVGVILGFLLTGAFPANPALMIAMPLLGLGLGMLLKAMVMYPKFANAPATDILDLMSDPYASPLRGKPAKLQGKLIGRGDAGNRVGSDLKLQDATGMLFLRYASRFGGLGNFFFGATRVQSLIDSEVETVGWFRRGVAPWMDLVQFKSESGTIVNSYHRFWKLVGGVFLVLLGGFFALV